MLKLEFELFRKSFLSLMFIFICSVSVMAAEPSSAIDFNRRMADISRSSVQGEALARALLNFQSDLEKAITYWEAQPESDVQFMRESELREIFYKLEPLFKVALNSSNNDLCKEQSENLEFDAHAGMSEGTIRPSYSSVQRLMLRLCPKK